MAEDKKSTLSGKGMKPFPSLSTQEIQDQFRRVLDSSEFIATESQRKLLQFIVSETLVGKSREIKGFSIATRVLGRGQDYDQATDPIVSMHASKLRLALERYYHTAGRQDPILIHIPKGTYIPSFSKRSSFGPPLAAERPELDACFESSRPCVLVKPFEHLGSDPGRTFLGEGLAVEIATELTRYQEIRVLRRDQEIAEKHRSSNGARFVIDGSVCEDARGLKVIARLTDTQAQELLWSDAILSRSDADQLIAFQETAACSIAASIACERGVIIRRLSAESSRARPARLSTYEALLRFYEFERTLSPDSFLPALDALGKAAVSEPECGHVWGCLARLYATIFSLEIPGFGRDDAEEQAHRHAEKAVALLPEDQRARSTLAYVRMLSDEVAGARGEIDVAYALNPQSLFNLDGIGYIMTLLGDWERGPQLIKKAMSLNPYYRPISHYALWVHALHRGDHASAYQETMDLRGPSLFWYPLAKAATLGLLGRRKEAKKYAAGLLEFKPDFPDRGRRLISRYIKQDEIAQQVIEGLKSTGVTVQ